MCTICDKCGKKLNINDKGAEIVKASNGSYYDFKRVTDEQTGKTKIVVKNTPGGLKYKIVRIGWDCYENIMQLINNQK